MTETELRQRSGYGCTRWYDEVQKALVDASVQRVIQQNGMMGLPGTTDDYIKRMRLARPEREAMIRDAGVTSE